MTQLFSDVARAELAADITDVATSFTITSGGSLFPVANTGTSAIGPGADWFKVVLSDPDGYEIVYVRTHTSGSDTFSNVLRGQEGTTARAFDAVHSVTGQRTVVGLRVSAVDFDRFESKEPGFAAGTTSQYFRGDKTWRDFATDVRAAVLTGLSTATNAVISASDTVLGALGKLQKQISDHLAATNNPHSVTKSQVGLGNVDNVSAANLRDRSTHTGTQAISTVSGLQTALDGKEGTITAGTTGQYWRGDKSWQTLDKAAVGLGNVDNTSDADKPVSIAQLEALGTKADKNEDGGVEAEYFKTPGGVLTPISSFKNKIINGGPVINQRHTAPITDAAGVSPYILDRWRMITRTGASVTGGIFNSGSGRSRRHIAITVNSPKTPASNDQFRLSQAIEGLAITEWWLGYSRSLTVTLSFDCCHSIAGVYSGAIYGGTPSSSYVFEYTQNTANVWETKEITLPLPTSGSWPIDNTVGLYLTFDYGTGSQYETSNTGVWQEGIFLRSSSSLRPITTAGAIVRFQAIQLEEGPYATPFEQRPITVEEALCERYYSTGELTGSVYATNTTSELLRVQVRHRQIMRATPVVNLGYITGNVGTFAVYRNNTKGFNAHFTKTGADPYLLALYSYVADAEL